MLIYDNHHIIRLNSFNLSPTFWKSDQKCPSYVQFPNHHWIMMEFLWNICLKKCIFYIIKTQKRPTEMPGLWNFRKFSQKSDPVHVFLYSSATISAFDSSRHPAALHVFPLLKMCNFQDFFEILSLIFNVFWKIQNSIFDYFEDVYLLKIFLRTIFDFILKA